MANIKRKISNNESIHAINDSTIEILLFRAEYTIHISFNIQLWEKMLKIIHPQLTTTCLHRRLLEIYHQPNIMRPIY